MTAYRSFSFNSKEIKEAIDKFTMLTNNSIDSWSLTTLEYNQIIRGKAFILTDCLMTSYVPGMNAKDEIELINEYCSVVIKFALKWFQMLPVIYQNVLFIF